MSKKETYKFEILNKDNYHIYYEDKDDNAGGVIVYKNLKNNEFFEQSAKIESLIDFYNTCEKGIMHFWHLLPFGKNENDKNKLILLTDIKSLQADLNEKEVDTFKLESEMQAATAIVEANMAEFEAEQQELKEKQQEERETLIAEAHRLAGRIEAFELINKFSNVGKILTLKKIQEEKIYEYVNGCKTFVDYCKYIGLSSSKVYEDINNLNTFGVEFSNALENLNMSYRNLKELKKQVKSGSLEVKESEVIIDGEIIPLDDKDELRDALDTLLKSKYREIEEKDKLLKDKESELKAVREIKDKFATEKKFAEDKVDTLETRINNMHEQIESLKKNKPSFKNVSDVDAEDFQKLLTLEQEWRDLFNALKNATDDDNLSSFNKSMLGGIVAQIMIMLDDFRMQLNGKSEFYFHGVEIDEETLNKQISPSDYLAMQNNK